MYMQQMALIIDEMSFALAEFGAPAPEANSQKVQNKRGNDSRPSCSPDDD